MKTVYALLAKSNLISFGLTVAASAEDAGTDKEIIANRMTALIFPDKEIEDMKIVKSLKEKVKKKTERGLYWYLGGFRDPVANKSAHAGDIVLIGNEGTIRAGTQSNELKKIRTGFLVLLHLLTNFEIKRYQINAQSS